MFVPNSFEESIISIYLLALIKEMKDSHNPVYEIFVKLIQSKALFVVGFRNENEKFLILISNKKNDILGFFILGKEDFKYLNYNLELDEIYLETKNNIVNLLDKKDKEYYKNKIANLLLEFKNNIKMQIIIKSILFDIIQELTNKPNIDISLLKTNLLNLEKYHFSKN